MMRGPLTVTLAVALALAASVPGAADAMVPCHRDVLVDATAAGGDVDEVATPIRGAADARAFVEQFGTVEFRREVRSTIAQARRDAGRGEQVVVATVAIGCDVPPGVDVARKDRQVVVTAQPVADPKPECFAPVTTVAVVTLRPTSA